MNIITTSERFRGLQDIADLLCPIYNIGKVVVELKDVKRGRVRRRAKKITLPVWATTYPFEFLLYYLVHELCHFITGGEHGRIFKQKETEILKRFNIVPIYGRAYAKELQDTTGKILWKTR